DGVRTWRKAGEGIGRRLCGVGAGIDLHLIRPAAATEGGRDGSIAAAAARRRKAESYRARLRDRAGGGRGAAIGIGYRVGVSPRWNAERAVTGVRPGPAAGTHRYR